MKRKRSTSNFVFVSNIKRLMAKNAWIDFLVSWRKSHPKVSMKNAMKLAAKDYKKKGKKKTKK